MLLHKFYTIDYTFQSINFNYLSILKSFEFGFEVLFLNQLILNLWYTLNTCNRNYLSFLGVVLLCYLD